MANGPLKTSGLAVSFFLAVMCLSQSRFFHEASRGLDFFFKGKEVSLKAPICLFVFINFNVFSSLDITFNNTTFKFPRNEVNPTSFKRHKTASLF